MDFELFDTLFSMIVGWAINVAIIVLATTTFFQKGMHVDELQQAGKILTPLLGNHAGAIFAVALLFAGIASSVTSGMAGGSIFAGMWGEPYDIKDIHSKIGVLISFVFAVLIILFIKNPFQGLIMSQMILSIQLPVTIGIQLYLTSSKKVMGNYANKFITKFMLYAVGAIVSFLNIKLLFSLLS
jgi:manganese transport protein